MASRMMGCLAFRGWARGSLLLLVVGRSAPTSHPCRCRWNQRSGTGCRWRARAQTETDSRRHRQTPPFEKLRWECTRKFVHKLFHQASGPPNPRKLKKNTANRRNPAAPPAPAWAAHVCTTKTRGAGPGPRIVCTTKGPALLCNCN